jgi:hypothetical protein
MSPPPSFFRRSGSLPAPPRVGSRPSAVVGAGKSPATRLKAGEDLEEALRREIAERNSAVANEERYAVADGELLEKIASVANGAEAGPDAASQTPSLSSSSRAVNGGASASVGSSSSSSPGASAGSAAAAAATTTTPVSRAVERLTRPRAYPLFLAEKAAEFVEATVADLSKALKGTSESPYDYYFPNGDGNKGQKERVVVLGTGWGAASFLKAVDTDRYDVTVVSPRNYFVFTPMLAGASVGTVEYRSITEPCVSFWLVTGKSALFDVGRMLLLTLSLSLEIFFDCRCALSLSRFGQPGSERSTAGPGTWRPRRATSTPKPRRSRASRSCATGTRAR